MDRDEVIERLSARRIARNAKLPIIWFLSHQNDKICDICQGRVIQRPDDRPEVIMNRLNTYEQQTKPLVDYYRSQEFLRLSFLKDRLTMYFSKFRRFWGRYQYEYFLRESDLNSMRQSGKILADTIKEAKKYILPGMKTAFIDEIVEKFIVQRGARPAFKGYRGFPASLCISINEQVVHGIPGERVIQDGDLVSVDIGVEYQGYYTDAAFSVVAGNSNGIAYQLVKVAKESLFEGIRKAKAGNRIGDVSNAIQKYIEKNNFSVVRDFVGHGLGLSLHEEPQIPNFGPKNQGPLIKKGMVLAIEPMVNEKGFQVQILDDGWTVVTRDQGLSAHYEHTVLITEDGPEILTMDRRGDE